MSVALVRGLENKGRGSWTPMRTVHESEWGRAKTLCGFTIKRCLIWPGEPGDVNCRRCLALRPRDG